MPKTKAILRKKYKKLVRRFTKYQRRRHMRTKMLIIMMGLIACALLALILLLIQRQEETSQPERLVTIHDRGQDHVILTHSNSVSAALDDAKIVIAKQDLVEPVIDSQLLTTDAAIIIYRARMVLVVDGSLRQKVMTPKQSPHEITQAAGIADLSNDDKVSFKKGDVAIDGANIVMTIERKVPVVVEIPKQPTANPLTAAKGAHVFVDSNGVAHRETYYDLPMNIVIGHCSNDDYSIREDGAKVDSDGYVLVAANYNAYPRCSVVETSLGPGKVYDTGGFALRYPHGFDLATDWTNNNGR
jgi:hypothetical protein